MHRLKEIKNGVTNALLLDDTFQRLEELGISVKADAKVRPLAIVRVEDFSPQIRFQALQMQQVYVGFFCLENAVRELIEQRLSERHKANWWALKVPRKIQETVEALKTKEKHNKYLSARSISDIGYTFFGNLSQIIISNWDDFSDLFPDQAWITSRFNDLEMCRNIIMHTNTLPPAEIERIDQIIRDWQTQVG
jgi:hypothetical protein